MTVTKKEQAKELFDRGLEEREAGKYETNRDFRQAMIKLFQERIDGVSGSSACTLYNVNKQRVMSEDPSVGLGRDPSKGKRAKVKALGTKVKTKVKALGTKVKAKVRGKKVVPVVNVPSTEVEDYSGIPEIETDPVGAFDLNPVELLSDDMFGESEADYQDAVHGAMSDMGLPDNY